MAGKYSAETETTQYSSANRRNSPAILALCLLLWPATDSFCPILHTASTFSMSQDPKICSQVSRGEKQTRVQRWNGDEHDGEKKAVQALKGRCQRSG